MNFDTKVEKLNKVGSTTAGRLKRIDIETVRDLLFYFPFRYEDYRAVVDIDKLRVGEMVSVKGKIELISSKRSARKHKIITEALISDETGGLRVIWFGQPYIIKTLRQGMEVYLSGTVKEDILGVQMVSPMYEKSSGKQTTHTARLVPMYPLTANLTQKQIRFLVEQIIELADKTEEWLPDEIMDQAELAPLSTALRGVHFPLDENDLAQSTNRLKFDELFLLQMTAELARKQKQTHSAPILEFKKEEIKNFVASLPFILTNKQKISSWEILQDLGNKIPMNRMLSGDVGCGKTVVAAMGLYDTVLNGYQAIMMAPTEILATQHYESLCKLLGDKLSIGLLTQGQALSSRSKPQSENKTKEKRDFLNSIKKGEIDIVVGTHALLSKGVEFDKLGFVIVDEQHRFGVEQRKTIKEKGKSLHFLSMTATPIPRSLALLLYGDLDVSIIDEMPKGRKEVQTRLVESQNRQKAYDFILQQVHKGRQVFVVCPLIEDSVVNAEKKSVMSEYKKLNEKVFPNLNIDFLHGKLKAEEKEKIMNDFQSGKTNVLVATSVIEVGVDIPNATVMMIEGAERFGLAQLHQFRGRVGRSIHQSYCFLFVEQYMPKAMERLKFFEKNNNGFRLAEKDLEMRGPGEVYGMAQSGMMNLRLAKLTDAKIIKKAREAAQLVVKNAKKFSKLIKYVKKWEGNIHLE